MAGTGVGQALLEDKQPLEKAVPFGKTAFPGLSKLPFISLRGEQPGKVYRPGWKDGSSNFGTNLSASDYSSTNE